MGITYSDMFRQDVTPNWREEPTYDALKGFPNGRKERVMVATEAEMAAADLTPEQRDYCAHHLIDFLRCRRDNFPWVASCKHEKHVLDSCQYDDFVLRMKEYERERRLMARSKRKAASTEKELMEE